MASNHSNRGDQNPDQSPEDLGVRPEEGQELSDAASRVEQGRDSEQERVEDVMDAASLPPLPPEDDDEPDAFDSDDSWVFDDDDLDTDSGIDLDDSGLDLDDSGLDLDDSGLDLDDSGLDLSSSGIEFSDSDFDIPVASTTGSRDPAPSAPYDPINPHELEEIDDDDDSSDTDPEIPFAEPRFEDSDPGFDAYADIEHDEVPEFRAKYVNPLWYWHLVRRGYDATRRVSRRVSEGAQATVLDRDWRREKSQQTKEGWRQFRASDQGQPSWYVEKLDQYVPGFRGGRHWMWDEGIVAYRKLREKNRFLKTADSVVRGLGGGAAGYGAAAFVKALYAPLRLFIGGPSLAGQVAVGGGFWSSFAIPGVAPVAGPLIARLGGRFAAKRLHEEGVQNDFEETMLNFAERMYFQEQRLRPADLGSNEDTDPQDPDAVADWRRDINRDPVHRENLGALYEDLLSLNNTIVSDGKTSRIDTLEEKQIVELMAEHAHCSPAEVPHLRDESRYARYCFVRFADACEQLLEKKRTGKVRLNPTEEKILSEFYIDYLDEETPDAASKREAISKLYQVSLEYGRLLAHEHRKSRRSQENGMLVGAVASSLWLGPVPLLTAGLYKAGSYLYEQSAKPKHLEFGPDGKLRVKIDVKDTEGRGHLMHSDVFNREIPEDDRTDAHKHWGKYMKFDRETLNDSSITSAKELGLRMEEFVLQQLVGRKFPSAKKDETAIKEAKTEHRECQRRSEACAKEIRTIVRTMVSADRTTKSMLQDQLDDLQSQLSRLQIEEQEAKDAVTKLENISGSEFQLGKDPMTLLTLDAYDGVDGHDEDAQKKRVAYESQFEIIREEFAFRVQQQWKKMQESRGSTTLGNIGARLSAGIKKSGVKGGAVAADYALGILPHTLGYGALGFGASYIVPAALASSTALVTAGIAVGALAGTVAYAKDKLKWASEALGKFSANFGKPDEKKEPEKAKGDDTEKKS